MSRPPVRAVARRAQRSLREQAQRLAPAGWLPEPDGAAGSIALVSVYRRRNAGLVAAMADQLDGTAQVRLWALDEPDPGLDRWTVGSGPGGRMSLLNRLVESLDPGRPDHVVVADDDVRFVIGDICRLVAIGAWLGFELYQPSHARTSTTAFEFTRRRPLAAARQTTFVEQGPVVVMSRAAQDRLLPLPEELVMGWGIEARWHRIAPELRRGIVDAVSIRHVAPPTRTYDISPEEERLQAELAQIGLDDVRQLHRTVRTVGVRDLWRARPGRRTPGGAR